jgi:hypothetical protein
VSTKKPTKERAEKQPTKEQPAFSKDVLAGVIKRLESGESLIEESKTLVGRPDNNPLRTALRELLGRAEYRKMIERSMEARKPTEPDAKAAEQKAPAAKKAATKKPTTDMASAKAS